MCSNAGYLGFHGRRPGWRTQAQLGTGSSRGLWQCNYYDELQEDSAMAGGYQSLTDDVLWHVAKHMTTPRDILSLGLTSKSVWNVVKPELYRAEVIQTRDEEIEVAGDLEPLAPSATTLERQSLLNDRPVYSQQPATHFSISNGYNFTTKSLIDAAKKLWAGYLDVLWGPGLTPLHLAAATGNTEVVKSLHEAGCFLNADAYLPTGRAQNFDNRQDLPALGPYDDFQLLHVPNWGEQVDALSLAIMHKQPGTAQYLLEHMGLRRPFTDNAERISPLHVAALVGDVKLVEALLDLKTALHYAAAHPGDNTAVLKLLLARGARIGAEALSGIAVLKFGLNALEVAVWNQHSPANAKFLLSYAVQNNRLEATNWQEIIDWKLYWDHASPAELAVVEPIDLVSEEQMKSSLLRMVSKNPEDDLPTVMFLVEKLFAPDSQHSGYLQPWDEQSYRQKKTQHYFKTVLQYRDWDLEASDVKGRTALTYAIYYCRYEAALMLMERNTVWKFRSCTEKLAMAAWLREHPKTEGRHLSWAARLEGMS
ncbi:hypothetical protein PG997_012785 [Apiospora hydei]|uniref:Uncharacterized protein n=1 Tax=Apiospora hydei TaxID=1337664 RepID=A0ABR1V4D3_9PEZI